MIPNGFRTGSYLNTWQEWELLILPYAEVHTDIIRLEAVPRHVLREDDISEVLCNDMKSNIPLRSALYRLPYLYLCCSFRCAKTPALLRTADNLLSCDVQVTKVCPQDLEYLRVYYFVLCVVNIFYPNRLGCWAPKTTRRDYTVHTSNFVGAWIPPAHKTQMSSR